MKVTLNSIFLVLSLIGFSSCQDTNDNLEVNPSNLTVDATVANDGSGVIDVVAKADNTVGYEFYTGDNVSGEPVYNSSGIFNYTYAESGIYTFETRAIGSNGKYLKNETILTIQVGDGPIDPEDGYTTPLSYPNMDLAWNDEFSGNTLNISDWTYEIGDGCPGLCGWGNNELQYYREENTAVGDGYLIIEARKESYAGSSYTSSRLITKDKQSFKYGRVDIRAVLPKGQGIWPALWMLGANINSVGWPKCGEIDIMEMIGGSGDNTSYGTIHWDNNGNHADYGGSTTLTNGIYNDKFHVFSIIWTATAITWYVDDVQFHTADITPAELSEFHENAFFIFNVAVGGNWPGSPNSSTIFPQQLKVDYIRVFQDQ